MKARMLAALAVAVLATAACSSPAATTPAESGTGAASPSASAPDAPSPDPSRAPTAAPTPTPAETPAAAPSWRQLTTDVASVGPREDHTWTLAPDGATAYLFGGRRSNGQALADLWAYDLATDEWREIGAAGPAARFGHNAAWVDGQGLVVFGGQAGADFFSDLWAFDPGTGAWRQLPAGGAVPVARYGSCAAIGPDGRLWISHGFTADLRRFSDTRAYDFATGSWTEETPSGGKPSVRCLHACWWTDDGQLALYGGQTTGITALGDLWHLAIGPRQGTHTWTRIELGGGPPSDRNLYAAARWRSGTLVFGGQALDGSYLADAWLLADAGGATRVTAEGSGPPPRSGAELIVDPASGRVLLFGGRDAAGAMSDLWELAAP